MRFLLYQEMIKRLTFIRTLIWIAIFFSIEINKDYQVRLRDRRVIKGPAFRAIGPWMMRSHRSAFFPFFSVDAKCVVGLRLRFPFFL